MNFIRIKYQIVLFITRMIGKLKTKLDDLLYKSVIKKKEFQKMTIRMIKDKYKVTCQKIYTNEETEYRIEFNRNFGTADNADWRLFYSTTFYNKKDIIKTIDEKWVDIVFDYEDLCRRKAEEKKQKQKQKES